MHLPAATDLRVSAAVQADVVAASLCLASHVRDGEITISHEGSRAGGEAAQAGSTMARRPTEKRRFALQGGSAKRPGDGESHPLPTQVAVPRTMPYGERSRLRG